MATTPTYALGLQTASWRGQEFYVESSSRTGGRKVIVHEYWSRNEPWLEDAGQATQQITIRGFLLGDDVYDQRAVFEFNSNRISGNGELIHPSYGSISCAIISISFGETTQGGNMLSFEATFIPSSAKSYPGLSSGLMPGALTNTKSAVSDAVANLLDASATDFFSDVATAIKTGVREVNKVVSTVQKYVNQAKRLIGDAQRIVNIGKGLGNLLPGGHSFGRFSGGFLSGPSSALNSVTQGLSTVRRVESGITGAISAASDARRTVTSAFNSISNFASAL